MGRYLGPKRILVAALREATSIHLGEDTPNRPLREPARLAAWRGRAREVPLLVERRREAEVLEQHAVERDMSATRSC